eukprot:1124758-Rhodomonas_salina.2
MCIRDSPLSISINVRARRNRRPHIEGGSGPRGLATGDNTLQEERAPAQRVGTTPSILRIMRTHSVASSSAEVLTSSGCSTFSSAMSLAAHAARQRARHRVGLCCWLDLADGHVCKRGASAP